MHQAQFVAGEIGGFGSAVDHVMAPVAGYSRLGIIWFASSTTGASQSVMCQHAGFRVAVAVPGDPDGAFAAASLFT